jgi:hypothetical protein
MIMPIAITKSANQICSILLFVQGKEMARKTRKQSKRHRRRTLRRKQHKGGRDSQSLIPPTSAFKANTPVSSDNAWYKIA